MRADRPIESDAAVIDVGSNSVRLVLYRVEGRAVWTVYNEKVLAGLGRDLSVTGKLSPKGVTESLAALRRFAALVGDMPESQVFTAATAAVREASDGQAFVRRVQAETGIRLRVLTGGEEGHYSALGILAGAPASDGVVGDLGGASLELIRLGDYGPSEGVTLPLGPFSFGDPGDISGDRLRKKIRQALEPVAGDFRTKTLNAVGGAWRNLALLQMQLSGYPLHIVHQYEMTRREALSACEFIAKQSRASLEGIDGLSRKRADTLPHAAAVMEGLIEALGLERIVLSAYGLREGLLFEAMPAVTRLQDPLIEGCAAVGARQGVTDQLGPALQDWVLPAFATLPAAFGLREGVLIAAACRLADLGARLHPDHRADLVFDQVLRAPIAGMTHAERAFLAVTAFSRHTASSNVREPQLINRLLSRDALQRARAVGSAIRLACDLSGRSPALLSRSRLTIDGGKVILEAEAEEADLLLGEQTAKRAATLAANLGRKLEMRSGNLATVEV